MKEREKSKKVGTRLTVLLVILAVLLVVLAFLLLRGCEPDDGNDDPNDQKPTDIKALIEDILVEIAPEDRTDAELVIFTVTDDGKINAFGYSQAEREMRPYAKNPIAERSASSTLREQTEEILAELVASGRLIKDGSVTGSSDRRHPDRTAQLVIDCGFDGEKVVIRADHCINLSFFGTVGFDVQGGVLNFNGRAYTGVYPTGLGGDGLYYKDGRLFDGSADGHDYLDGALLITASIGSDGALVYELPTGDYVTERVHLYLPLRSNEKLAGYYDAAQKGSDNTWTAQLRIELGEGTWEAVALSTYVADAEKNILYKLTHGKADELTGTEHIPSVVDSAWFCEYLERAYDCTVNRDNFEEYMERYLNEHSVLSLSYADFLRQKLGTTELSEALDGSFEDIRANVLGTKYGGEYSERMPDGEVAQLMTDAMYRGGIIYSLGAEKISLYDLMQPAPYAPEMTLEGSALVGTLEVEHPEKVWTAAFTRDDYSCYYPTLLVTLMIK